MHQQMFSNPGLGRVTGIVLGLMFVQMPGAVAQTVPSSSPPVVPARALMDQASLLAIPTPPHQLGKTAVPPKVTVVMPGQAVEQLVADTEASQMSSGQMRRIKELGLRKDREAASVYLRLPRPVTRSLNIPLSPGTPPPVIRLAYGNVSSVVFSDGHGHAWPIRKVTLNRTLFSDGREASAGVPPKDDAGTNVLELSPFSSTAYGNVAVMLKGLSTPVIFMLAAGQPEVDIRVDARIPGSSPDAPPVPVVIAMPQHDAHLIGFLDGVPPDQARRVSVDGLAGAEGWLFRQSLYLRVLGQVQYPAFLAKAGGTDGTQVYQFSGDVRSVVVLRDGRAMTLFVREP